MLFISNFVSEIKPSATLSLKEEIGSLEKEYSCRRGIINE